MTEQMLEAPPVRPTAPAVPPATAKPTVVARTTAPATPTAAKPAVTPAKAAPTTATAKPAVSTPAPAKVAPIRAAGGKGIFAVSMMVVLAGCIIGVANLFAQAPGLPKITDEGTKAKADAKKAAEPTKGEAKKTDSELITPASGDLKSVFVVICDSQPGKIIVLDSDGKWVPSVKTVEVKFDVGGPATIICGTYEGPFRPTTPQTKTWRLAQMKTVSNAEFQGMIDSLQTDPEAIRKSLSKGDEE